MRLTLVLAALAMLAVAAPATARARTGPPLQPFPQPESLERPAPVSDGSRYFVINAAPGTVRVYDTETGASSDLTVPTDCVAVDAAVGTALVTCKNGREPYVLRLRTLALYAPPYKPPPGYAPETWLGIGRHWLRGHQVVDTGNKLGGTYLNWRTGQRFRDQDDVRGTEYDVDDPRLRRYTGGVFDRGGSLALAHRTNIGLRLIRPGPDVRLSRCGCFGRVEAGLASWTERLSAHVYDARARTRHGWRTDSRPRAVVHTREHVLVALKPLPGGAPRLLWARVRK